MSSKKIIQQVVHTMTTSSGTAASADPAVDLSNSHSQQGPSDNSVAATGDHGRLNLVSKNLLKV